MPVGNTVFAPAGLAVPAGDYTPSGTTDGGTTVLLRPSPAADTATELIRAAPYMQTFTTEAVDELAATIPVENTQGFASDGVVRYQGELISYTGLTPTSFVGCARGQFLGDGGYPAQPIPAGSLVVTDLTAAHHRVLVDSVLALQRRVNALTAGAVNPGGSYYEDFDDFLNGSAADGTIGKWGWNSSGNGSISVQTSTNTHPGIVRVGSGATSGNTERLFLGPALWPGNVDTLAFHFRLTNNPPQRVRIGLVDNMDSPANGFALEYFSDTYSDATFQGVNWLYGGAARVRAETPIVPVLNAWYLVVFYAEDLYPSPNRLYLERRDTGESADVGFATTDDLAAGYLVVRSATGANNFKGIDVDWCYLRTRNIVR